MKKAAKVLAVIIFLSGISGCAITKISANKVFRSDGIPTKEYYVGGGYQCNYVAPTKGVIYLADSFSGKLLETRSLEPNEGYSSPPINFESDEHLQALKNIGIDPEVMKIEMYFVPSEKI